MTKDKDKGGEMETSIGVNLRVTAHSTQGGRKYMEDMFCVAYQPTTDERDLLYAYFGIFDGHGGKEAALFAKQHLMDHIVSQKNFWSEDDTLILKAIRDGFINTHYAMWKELDRWPKTPSGLPSTSGTTASIAFVRRGKLYIGHVGDSAITLGYQDSATGFWKATPLTKDHKPEGAAENARILKCGGKVINKSGVPRVVWNRPRVGHKGPVRRSTTIDEIPFLAVARSLGDLWSYNSAQDKFVVSPIPDVSVVDIDVDSHRCLILGSDGLWNMLTAQDAVNSVYFAEKNNERQLLASPTEISSSQVKNWINPSKRLVDRALDRWYHHNLRADNTSVVTVVIDPPGPPKAQVVRQNQKNYEVRESISSVTNPTTSKTVPAMILAPTQGKQATSQAIPSIPTSIARPSVPCVRNGFASRVPHGPARVISRPVMNSLNNLTSLVTSQIPDQPTSSLRVVKSISRKRKHDSSSPCRPNSTQGTNPSNLNKNHPRLNTRSTHNEKHDSKILDDVQIHEISSSSESSKSSNATAQMIPTETSSKRQKRSSRADNTVRINLTRRTRRTRTKVPSRIVKDRFLEKPLQSVVSTTMKTRSGSPRLHYLGQLQKLATAKRSIIANKSTAIKSHNLASSRGRKSRREDIKLDVSSTKRSLRSSSRNRTRVTRSMKN